jgi:hypothetical protein
MGAIFSLWLILTISGIKKKGLKISSKRNTVKQHYGRRSNEDINDSEDIHP